MPAKKSPLSEQEEIEILKEKAVAYYRQLPVKSLAAAKVGRSYDAFNEWENNDARFARRLQEAKADFAVEQIKNRKMTPQFVLERVFKQEFGASVDLTSKGEKITPIYGGLSVQGHHRDQEDIQPQETN